jgi:NAD(P)H-flavin reductase/ferredoxin
MYSVTVLPFERQIECSNDETLLAAVLRQGCFVRYGCRHGGCGTCRALLIDGDIDAGGSSYALTPGDRAQGWVLLCSSRPVSDCVVDVESMELSLEEFESGDQVGAYEAVVESIEALTADIRGLSLRLSEPMSFTAGQFVNVEIPGTTEVRSYSIASSPRETSRIDLIIKLMPGGAFSRHLETSLAIGDTLRLFGPLGSLRFRLSHRKVVMVAGGSGLAPFLSMLHDLAERGETRPVDLVFGARNTADLYRQSDLDNLAATLPAFRYLPALSDPGDDLWDGATGMVTDAIALTYPSLRGYDAYVAGPPAMVDATIPLLVDLGVRPQNVYFDAFVPTVPLE